MFKRNKNKDNAEEKRFIEEALTRKQAQDKQNSNSENTLKHYIDVYISNWRQEILRHFNALLSVEEKQMLSAADASHLLSFIDEKLCDADLDPSQKQFLIAVKGELTHLEGLRRELKSPSKAQEYAHIAAMHEEMDLLYREVERVYEHLIPIVDKKFEIELEAYLRQSVVKTLGPDALNGQDLYRVIHDHRQHLHSYLLDDAHLHALVHRIYSSIEPDVIDGVRQIKEASHLAKKKNPEDFPLSSDERHVPQWTDMDTVLQKVENFKKFVAGLQFDPLKERVQMRLASLL